MSAPGSSLLFVYGTLKRGCCNHPFLAGQTFVGEARTEPGFRLHDLGEYPGLVRAADDRDGVFGEVWSVTPAALAEIDDLEGAAAGLYRRETVPLLRPFDQDVVETYVYLQSVDGRADLGGRWKE